ncbi:hypothetical protein Cal7507_5159 [Calothrix sp. PCC 7507]|nr:hypothetical protein Cal7507_5159 [Calothrix sp. PCC 7507]
MAQGRKILGADKLTDLIVNEVMLECDADSYSWFWQTFLGQSRYEEIQRKAQNQVFQMLVNIGLEPGKDFSFGLDSEMMISDRTQETLLSTYAGTTNFSLPASPKAL